MVTRQAVALLLLALPLLPAALPPEATSAPYPLLDWRGASCGSKGRFQDREYCRSEVMDRIVTDGKKAIPILIEQITDERRMQEPALDFWPPLAAGELAVLILEDLFLDETWERRTIPDLIPDARCKEEVPASECWARFRAKHSLGEVQVRWRRFWKANEGRVFWDEGARCFRVNGA